MKRIHSAWILLPVVALLTALVLFPIVPARADFGTNWSATFFNDATLGSSGAVGVPVTGINGLNFNWGTNPPSINSVNVPGIGSDNFSARFTSTQALTPGTYNFIVTSDDGVRVYINGALVLDKFVGRPATTDTFTQVISTSPVNMTVEYFEGIDQAQLQFQWFLVGGVTPGATTGPLGFTTTPLVTSVPLTASVVSVRGLAVRSGPYLGGSLVTVARPGNQYVPLAQNKDEGQFTWYLLQVGEKTGWASGRYLEFTGDPAGLPTQGTVFEQIDGAPDIGVTAIPRSVMNLRRRPSQRTALLAQIPWGAELSLIGRTIQGGRNHWLQVRYNAEEGQSLVGWIYAPFVSIRGDLNSVPIY
jgi:hypothetical protein